MLLSQIPQLEDLRDLTILDNVFLMTRDRLIFGPALNNNPLPSRCLPPLDQIDILAAKQYATENNLEYFPDHHIMDELYHYATRGENIPEATKEHILYRIQHPQVVYSAVTKELVSSYKNSYGKAATEELLQHSCAPWQNSTTPIKYYNSMINPRASMWPEVNLTTLLRTIQLQQTRHITPEMFLKPHNTKATDTFQFKYGATPAYTTLLGIELELENLTEKAIPILTKLLGTHAIFKRDGSVYNGVEICTAPATLDIHKEVFKSFFENKETALQVRDNCGLHIHVERKNIKQTHLAKIMMFMNNEDNNSFIESLAGRAANSYCQREDHSWETLIRKTSGDKYTRVNLRPEHTIEFRLFASTMDIVQFSRCLEFVQAVVDYTRTGEHNCSIKDVPNKEPFMKYLDDKHQFYPELYKHLFPSKIKAKGVTI